MADDDDGAAFAAAFGPVGGGDDVGGVGADADLRFDLEGQAECVGGLRVRSVGLTRTRRFLRQIVRAARRPFCVPAFRREWSGGVWRRGCCRRRLRLRRGARGSGPWRSPSLSLGAHSALRLLLQRYDSRGSRCSPASMSGTCSIRCAWRGPCQPPISVTASRRREVVAGAVHQQPAGVGEVVQLPQDRLHFGEPVGESRAGLAAR